MKPYQEKDKNGKIHKTKDGRSWRYRCYYTDSYGNRRRKKSGYFFKREEAAEAQRIFLLNAAKNDPNSNDANITFSDIYNEYLEYKKNILKCTSFYRIKKTTDKHILQYFQTYKLHSIKINVLNNWKEELSNKNLSLPYQNKIIGNLQEILSYARENYDFDIKVANKLQKRRIDTISKKSKSAENNFLTYEEFKQFIATVDNEYYSLIFNFLYSTELRIGEMIALTWEDLDLNNGTLKIYKSFSNKVEGKKFVITDPKTSNSKRIIDLDDELLELLKKHKKAEEKIINFNEDMFIFGNIKHLAPTTLSNHLNKYIKIANIKKITLHGFRHSHVSLLISLGCDSRDVAERIGDTVEIVEKTYYHMFPSKKKQTVIALNNLKNRS